MHETLKCTKDGICKALLSDGLVRCEIQDVDLVRGLDDRQVGHRVQVDFPPEGQLPDLEELDGLGLSRNVVGRFHHRGDGELQPAEVVDVADKEVVVDDENVQNVVDVADLEAPLGLELELVADVNECRHLSRRTVFCQRQDDDVEKVFAAVVVPDDARSRLKAVGREVVEHGVVFRRHQQKISRF